MGTYRTKPEEVEAVQFTGDASQPFAERTPAWVWSALTQGVLRFHTLGMTIEYSGLSEHVGPNDWLVMSADGIIRACEDKVFKQYYTSYRIRRTKAEIDAERKAEEEAAKPEVDAAALLATAASATATITDADVAEMEKALEAAFPELNVA